METPKKIGKTILKVGKQILEWIAIILIGIINIPSAIFYFIKERGFGAFFALLLWCAIGIAFTIFMATGVTVCFSKHDSIIGAIICCMIAICAAIYTIVGAIEFIIDC